MLVYINGRFLTKKVTGVTRYARELLGKADALLETDAFSRIRMICLAPPEHLVDPGWKNIEIRKVGINHQNLWEQVDLPLFARGHLLFSPSNSGPVLYPRQVVTIHDASVFALPSTYSRAFRTKYNVMLKMLTRRARMILTVSQFSRKELEKHLGIPSNRIHVIYNGSDHLVQLKPDSHVLERNHLIKYGYLLTVASNALHKNYASIISIARKYSAQGIQFAAVGGIFQGIFQATKLQDVPENVKFLGYVNDNELKALYENALGFIFPSFYEGFGLPVLEAMQAGCPVLCANSASLPEVGGDSALYFNPTNPDDLSNQTSRFLSDANLREIFRARGFERAAKFQWENTARETLEVLIRLE